MNRGEAAWGKVGSHLDEILEVEEMFATWRATDEAWNHTQAQKQPDQRLEAGTKAKR